MSPADLERTETWTAWQKKLCDNCVANCCRLPVEVRTADLIRMGLMDAFEADEPKSVAKRLMQDGIIARFNHKTSIFTLVQHSSGDCLYLDRQTRRCSIYDKRPDTCRNHPTIGPRPGFCAYEQQLVRK